jgi:hypothetical protein
MTTRPPTALTVMVPDPYLFTTIAGQDNTNGSADGTSGGNYQAYPTLFWDSSGSLAVLGKCF